MGNNSIKSLLNLYLEKVAKGESTYLDRLISQLAERLVYIPVITRTETRTNGAANIKVEALCIKEEQRSLVPVFTQEKMLREWCASHNSPVHSTALICADFCGALAADSWIWVNPGAENSVRLEPALVEKIARTSGAVFHAPEPAASPAKPAQTPCFEEERL